MGTVDNRTPEQHRHVQLPNSTYDDLLSHNANAIPLLMFWLRHTANWNPTLRKFQQRAGKIGADRSSAAYRTLIARGYLGRVEFGYQPPPDIGGAGQRHTVTWFSNVPMTAEGYAELVADYRPGKHVFVPLWMGELDEDENRVYVQRRVKILSAEVYSWKGTHRIDGDGLLAEHDNARGGKSKRALAAAAAPEPGKPGSGMTRENGGSSQVAPEHGYPSSGKPCSINKTNKNTKEHQAAGAVAGAPLPPGEDPPTSDLPPDDAGTSPDQAKPDPGPGWQGESPPAREPAGSSQDTSSDAEPAHNTSAFDHTPTNIPNSASTPEIAPTGAQNRTQPASGGCGRCGAGPHEPATARRVYRAGDSITGLGQPCPECQPAPV